ncbi:hypothetical protein BAJUN_02690 [Bajunvirus bajun]|uniref:Uncharacterized protein n=1 Tax=Brevundimonas phage vB_BgoS-Bajun TaxID=2948594 RepID=A0A9E7N6I6_9CAUD|nr:hypothetical protein BAJUN_02690 [Brevundimonas phage vB_BgoS-Bajun]
MSMRAMIGRQVQNAFRQLGDIPVACDYVHLTGGETRDIEAGVTTPNTVTYAVPLVVKAKFVEKEIDKHVDVSTDMKMLMPRLDLNKAVVDPRTSDKIIEKKNGRLWEVVRLLSDPADACLIFHVRTVR